jgi:hypothetical protein
MGSAQIIAVGFADAEDFSKLLPTDGATVHQVDDFEEAAELAPVVGAALVVCREAPGLDPLEHVGVAPLLAVFEEGNEPRARIFAKPPDSAEWIALGPARELLAPVVAALVEKGAQVARVDLPDNAGLKRRLGDLGINALVKTPAGDASVQTELHMIGKRAVVRSLAFSAGRIALSRRFTLGFAASPLDEAKWLVDAIHRETCALLVGREA